MLGLRRYFIDYGSDGDLDQVWMVWNREGLLEGVSRGTHVDVIRRGEPLFERHERYFQENLLDKP